MAKGIITEATVPDHIRPLAFGGLDVDENVQCLCDECHALKTAIEGASTGGASNHPDWLHPSAIPLTILCGPPGAGKSTHIEEHQRPGDVVIDLDRISKAIEPSYQPWTGRRDPALLNKAIRARNAMLGALEHKDRGQAWFVVSAPTQEERDWWAFTLGGTVVLLHPGVAECKRRALARGTPKAAKGVDEWERRSRLPWRPSYHAEAGEDGWPIDPRHPANRPR